MTIADSKLNRSNIYGQTILSDNYINSQEKTMYVHTKNFGSPYETEGQILVMNQSRAEQFSARLGSAHDLFHSTQKFPY